MVHDKNDPSEKSPADDIDLLKEVNLPREDESSEKALVPFDPLQMYLAEIRRCPLLSREEEHRLAVEYKEFGNIEAAYKLVTSNLRLAGKSYSATMVEKVGPFRVEFPMRIEVLESQEMSRIKAQAAGSDSRVGSRLKVELDVHLKGDGAKTLLSLGVSVDILGKLATLGHSIVKRKADQVMEEFARALKNRLEGVS